MGAGTRRDRQPEWSLEMFMEMWEGGSEAHKLLQGYYVGRKMGVVGRGRGVAA